FVWKTDPETGQTLMSGMGMLHLEIKQHRMERDFRLRVRVGKPRVSYRETLRKPIRVEGECVRQMGTTGLFAKVTVEFEPHQGDEAVTVVNKLDPEVVPPLLRAAAERGVRGALESGELGFPVMHVRATLLDAQLDDTLSNETAFEAAGADAVRRAMRDNIILLEPVMWVEVTVPEEFLGPVQSDLLGRRAEIDDIIYRGKLRMIEARVPLRGMFDYAAEVRSLSQGRASWTMEPHAYAPAPPEVLHALLHPEEY
ncbi:MAG TPA: elongation factor G, partial [Gemmataceae bacterium]|nr:elongation factor G [Gemmataceae bacterium]